MTFLRSKKKDVESRQKEDKDKLSDIAYTGKYGSPSDYKLNEDGSVAGIKEFEDLLEIIGFGKWNIRLFIACSMCLLIAPMQNITYEFLGVTPDYWCHVDELTNANWTDKQIIHLTKPPKNETKPEKVGCVYYNYNYSLAVELGYDQSMENLDAIKLDKVNDDPISCNKRDYNHSVYTSTLVTEWDLVCENRALFSTTQAASQIGILVGALSSGWFSDKFGRRTITLVCILCALITGILAAVIPIFSIFVIVKILVSAFTFGYYSIIFVIVMELCSPSERNSVGCLYGIPWSIGYMIVPGIAYIIKPWRWLQFTYSVLMVFAGCYYWALPESPRWLITKGRYEEAIQLFSTAAKTNNRALPPKEALMVSMEKMIPKEEKKEEETGKEFLVRNLEQLFVLVVRKDFRMRALILFFCWFAVSMVYYGVSLNSKNLDVNSYLYVFFGGLIEIPNNFVGWAMFVFLGRRKSILIMFFLTAGSISLIAILQGTLDDVSPALIIFLALAGKFCIGATFGFLYVFTTELFPTNYRALTLGECSAFARFGSISSPYINDILGARKRWGPSLLFSIVSLVAGTVALFLPETNYLSMPEQKKNGSKDGNVSQENNQEKEISANHTAKTNEAFEAN